MIQPPYGGGRMRLWALGTRALVAENAAMTETSTTDPATWREQAVAYARIMSHVTWTPVADGMPIRGGGQFRKGVEYTGVPYSSVKSVGRYIGFDIFLKTFLAAAENPLSVLYTEDLSGTVSNAGAYYGKVCSSYTSYALQCGIWYVSRHYGPAYREGICPVEPQSAHAVKLGDIIYTAPPPGGHVEMVTAVARGDDGRVTHVRIEESCPPTTRDTNRTAAEFEAHLAPDRKTLYRITDLDAWRGPNRAESLRFPDYEEDSAAPAINRVLLLDRGDWVAYHRDQTVKINVMDRDAAGVEALVIKRGDTVVEELELPDKCVVERSFATCGDYTAHCVLDDGSASQACEFAVCDLDFSVSGVTLGQAWEIAFRSANLDVAIVYLYCEADEYAHRTVFLTEEDRQRGSVTIPADLVGTAGTWQIWLIGENRYGRLKKRRDTVAVEARG
jgi:hypothetical protein